MGFFDDPLAEITLTTSNKELSESYRDRYHPGPSSVLKLALIYEPLWQAVAPSKLRLNIQFLESAYRQVLYHFSSNLPLEYNNVKARSIEPDIDYNFFCRALLVGEHYNGAPGSTPKSRVSVSNFPVVHQSLLSALYHI